MKLKKLVAGMLLALGTTAATADITDGHFSTNQIFDVQYYWSGTTLNASNFIAPYDMNFSHPTVAAGQYFAFFNSTTNPGTYGLGLYNSNGTLAQVVHNTGTLQAIGPDALFYIGSGFFGTVITTSAGYAYGSNASFASMDTSVSSTDASSYTWASTTPLSAGQTASSTPSNTPAPSGPTYVAVTQPTVVSVTPTSTNSPPGETAEYAIDGDPSTKYLNFDRANAGFTIKLQSAQVLQGIKFTTANDFEARDPSKYSLFGSNDGVNWTTIVNAESISLSSGRYTQSSMYTIANTNPYFYYFITFPDIKASAQYSDIIACGLACDSVQIGDVEFIYDSTFVFTAPTDTGNGTIANPGTAGSVSSLPTPVVGPQAVTVASGGTGSNASGATVLTVTNSGIYVNNGTAGDITNSGDFTNTGLTGSVNNTGTFTNSVTGVTGDVTNSGTFTNDGTTGNVVNQPGGTFTNNGTTGTVENGLYTGVFVNNGTTSSVINRGTFTNNASGTTGNVNNSETFNNYGQTGSVNNSGTFNNQAGGTVTELSYNNHQVHNHGTIGSVTYQGGGLTNYADGTIGSINTTQAHGNFNNQGTVTGDVTTNGNFVNQTTGSVQGTYTNTGTLNNYGTVYIVSNNSIFNNRAGALVTGLTTNSSTLSNLGTMASVTNTGTFTNAGTAGSVNNSSSFSNTGTVGDVTNSGTFINTGIVSSINNSGSFDTSGAQSINLTSYTQSNTGTTVIDGLQTITVNGTATLDGTLSINNAPTQFGRYTFLTAQTRQGEFSTVSGLGPTGFVRYTDTGLQYLVTPAAADVQPNIDLIGKNLGNVINLQSSPVTSSLGNDCSTFGSNGACLSINYAQTKASTGDLQSGGITVAKKINNNWRAGLFVNSPFTNSTIGAVSQEANEAYGGFVAWNKNADGKGLGINLSAAKGTGNITVNRPGPDAGVGNAGTDAQAIQVKATYAKALTDTVTVTPYLGVRYSELNIAGYTEQGAMFPLTVNATKKTSTDLVAGVSLSKQITDKLSGNVSAGIIQNISGQNPTYTGTSEIVGLNTFSGAIPSNGSTSPSLGAGLAYSITNTQKVGVNLGWQQKGSNADITSVGVSYTIGF